MRLPRPEKMSNKVTITYFNIILYALSYQLQRPVEPFLVRSLIHNFGEDASKETAANQTYGNLTSFFSAIQTIGSPLVGILFDKIGTRRTSILVYLASAASYAILANATSANWLYLSKVPTILQHAFLVGQATVASLSTEDNQNDLLTRAAALGRMTTAYTIGATIGPALGGYLATNDLYAGARLAVWGSLISVALSAVYLKDHRAFKKQSDDAKAATKDHPDDNTFLQSIKRTLSFLLHPTIGPLLFIKLLNGVSSSAFSTILPLVLANKLKFSSAELGYFMSASSLSVAVFACVGITPAMKLADNRSDRLSCWGVGFRALSLILFGGIVSHHITTTTDLKVGSKTLLASTLASIAVSLASHAHATSLTTLTTGSVSPDERGAILGLEHGLFSMARIVGPPLGTTLLSLGPTILLGGADGLWRVVTACVTIDFVLVALLKVWSTWQHSEIEANGNSKVQSYEQLIKDNNDHDHSD
jgi:OCT family organic cation transporter-like MFS transporter 18